MDLLSVEQSALRIALFSGNYNCVTDGPALALNRLVSYLLEGGSQVRVFAPTIPHPAFSPTGELISVPSIPLPGRPEYRLAFGLPSQQRRQLAAFRPQIFHLSAPDWLGWAALRQARRLGCPVVASYHTRFDRYLRYYGAAALEPLATRLLMSFYNRCDLVLAPCESMAEELQRQGMQTPIAIWGRGVDTEHFSPRHRNPAWRRAHGIGETDLVVLFVGRLVREKGLDRFTRVIRGARERTQKKLAVVIVGDGPARDWFSEHMPEARFSGHLSGKALAAAYANADIFFNPSDTETFGNVTLEAMASGLACLCVDAPGSRSLISHEATGLLAPANPEEHLINSLVALVENEGMRSRLAAAARQAALCRRWEVVLQSVVDHYHRLLMERYRIARPATVIPLVPARRALLSGPSGQTAAVGGAGPKEGFQ